MELAFLTLLLKDGADSVSGGVAIDNEGIFEAGLAEDRGRTNSINKRLKGRFVFIFPVEFATLSAKRDKCIERGSEGAKIPNVHAIEIEET